MEKKYQVTLFCTTKQYRPVSTIIEIEEVNLDNITDRKKVQEIGIRKICGKRYWDMKDLQRYHYTKVKVREKIEES